MSGAETTRRAPTEKVGRTNHYRTPPELIRDVRRVLGGRARPPIDLDPCGCPDPELDTVGALRTIRPPEDGLSVSWGEARTVFVNPPYSREPGSSGPSPMYAWIDRAVTYAERRHARVAILLSASSRWDQPRWQRLFSRSLSHIVVPTSRVKYLTPEGVAGSPPYPSLLWLYGLQRRQVDVQAAFPTWGILPVWDGRRGWREERR